MNRDNMNLARAVHYGLFAAVFNFFDDTKSYESIVKTIDLLSKNAIDDNSARAFNNMRIFLENGGFKALKEESDMVFYSPSTTFIPTTASYYDEKRDDGKKHLQMIEYVLKSKFRRDDSTCKEHEDHIEFILLFMQKLIEEELKGDKDASTLCKEVFANILNPMIDEFCENLYKHESSNFYKDIAVVLKVFMELEREILDVSKPIKEVIKDGVKPTLDKEKQPPSERVKKNMQEVTSFVE